MTLPVRLLEILSSTSVPVETQVYAKEEASVCCDPDFTVTQEAWDMYIPSDPCVMEKFEDGLRRFKSDTEKLRSIFMEQW
jgi:transaldolase